MKSIACLLDDPFLNVSFFRRNIKKGISVHYCLKQGEPLLYIYIYSKNRDFISFDIRDIFDFCKNLNWNIDEKWLFMKNSERMKAVCQIVNSVNMDSFFETKPFDLSDVPF